MNEQPLAVLLSCVMLAVFLIAFVAIIAYWTRTGTIRRSPLATRREKNIRHLVTIATLGIAVACTVVCMFIDRRIGGYFLLASIFFALFIGPMRTVFIETGLRRTKRTSPDPTTPSSPDLN
jgi:hypothetical protein